MNAKRLAEIREGVEAATGGTWRVRTMTLGMIEESVVAEVGDFWVISTLGDCAEEERDAEFIAHRRQDILDLLAEVDYLKGWVERLQEWVDEASTEEWS